MGRAEEPQVRVLPKLSEKRTCLTFLLTLQDRPRTPQVRPEEIRQLHPHRPHKMPHVPWVIKIEALGASPSQPSPLTKDLN